MYKFKYMGILYRNMRNVGSITRSKKFPSSHRRKISLNIDEERQKSEATPSEEAASCTCYIEQQHKIPYRLRFSTRENRTNPVSASKPMLVSSTVGSSGNG
jgi:hypothetical protein